jgi:hypothetical protein
LGEAGPLDAQEEKRLEAGGGEEVMGLMLGDRAPALCGLYRLEE